MVDSHTGPAGESKQANKTDLFINEVQSDQITEPNTTTNNFTHCSLVEFNLSVSEIRHLFEGIH